MHPEQQANLDACIRKGFAIRLSKRTITASAVLDAIDKLLHDAKAKEEVQKFQQELMKWDGPANAAKFLYEKFGRE
jgi:UDP:flavonoid glycosyltransferase YjiC (YdhE family)